MRREIAGMMDWLWLVLWLALLALVILSDAGIVFPSERDYLLLYVTCVIGVGFRIVRIINQKSEVIEEGKEE